MKTEPINIGQKVQLFFDNYIIEMSHFLTREMHSPQKSPYSPLIKKDRPWEEVVFFFAPILGTCIGMSGKSSTSVGTRIWDGIMRYLWAGEKDLVITV